MTRSTIALCCLLALTPSCSLLQSKRSVPAAAALDTEAVPAGEASTTNASNGDAIPSLAEWFKTEEPGDPTLYPNGEGPLDAPTPGFEVESGSSMRSVEPTESGRMHLLELYQQAIDEREALEKEVLGIPAALEQTYADLESTQQMLSGEESRTQALETERDGLLAENADLAGRLATAQIRRLEAEKMLLEAKIELARYLEGTGVPAQGEAGRP